MLVVMHTTTTHTANQSLTEAFQAVCCCCGLMQASYDYSILAAIAAAGGLTTPDMVSVP